MPGPAVQLDTKSNVFSKAQDIDWKATLFTEAMLQQIRFPIPTKTQHGPLCTSNMIKKFCEKLIDNLTTCLKSMEKVSLMIS